MKLQTMEELEIRGFQIKKGKTGSEYLVLNLEDETGYPCSFYSKNLKLSDGLTRGDHVLCALDYNPIYKSIVLSDLERI